jgi:hypothetical protein
MGTSLDEAISETADLYAFIFHALGLTPKLGPAAAAGG